MCLSMLKVAKGHVGKKMDGNGQWAVCSKIALNLCKYV